MLDLRPRQVAAIDSLRSSVRSGKKRIMLQGPVGFGKTLISATMTMSARANRKRVAFAAPAITIVDQAFERFREYGISPGDMGVQQSDHPWHRPYAPIQICSLATVGQRGFPEADLVFIDEAHVRLKATQDWMDQQTKAIFIGLSASPWSKGLAEQYDDLVIPATLQQMIDEGDACQFRAFAPHHPDLSGIGLVGDEYNQGQLSDRLRKPKLVADIVGTWLDMAEGRSTLVFAVDRAHAAMIHDQFMSDGVDSAYVDAETSRDDRRELGRRLNAGSLSVIVSVGTMTQGVDLDVRCVVLARPTKSEILLYQAIGRGLRAVPGKRDLLILDHSDSLLTLGLPTDINHDTLRSGARLPDNVKEIVKPAAKPRECPQCKILIAPTLRDCQECGWRPVIECNVTTVPGKLIDFATAFEGQMRLPKKDRRWSETTRAQFYSQLAAYAIERGFKPGWAAFQFKEMFGEWPNQHDQRGKVASACGPAVKSWIKSQMIRKAKAKSRPIAVAAE